VQQVCALADDDDIGFSQAYGLAGFLCKGGRGAEQRHKSWRQSPVRIPLVRHESTPAAILSAAFA
jgi:hypothetical protein